MNIPLRTIVFILSIVSTLSSCRGLKKTNRLSQATATDQPGPGR
ncbi:MAG TPA: hypothetical protein VL727_15240 [Puia sp.]|nr:hypothetical protein [Puia sp.]